VLLMGIAVSILTFLKRKKNAIAKNLLRFALRIKSLYVNLHKFSPEDIVAAAWSGIDSSVPAEL
jgi:hypothetical protein